MGTKFTCAPFPPDTLGFLPPAAAEASLVELLNSLPAGRQVFWGVPFELAASAAAARWLWLEPTAAASAEVELGALAHHVVFAHFVIAPPGNGASVARQRMYDRFRNLGEPVAEYVLAYADGSEWRATIRRYFEIGNIPTMDTPFIARSHDAPRPLDWRGPSEPGLWGEHQQSVAASWTIDWRSYELERFPIPKYWIYALENPRPEVEIRALRLVARGTMPVGIAGITLYHGTGHPLRHRRLETIRLDLPDGVPDESVRVDLGIVARQYRVEPVDVPAWLVEPNPGWGSPVPSEPRTSGALLVDVSAADDSTLEVAGARISMATVFAVGGATDHTGRVHAELLTPERQWVGVTVVDAETGRPTPARVNLRSPDGRYLPPYGHRHEVNDHWFEDYGADLRLGGTSFAYVDGRFDIELPVGDVLLEAVKGFEYTPFRSVVKVSPGQRALVVPLEHVMDWRKRGWVAADTHVHFLSPQTAWLEAQAEGVNIVNLLASQWGDLFTNFGDLTGQPFGASRDDTVIWVGTENRQHMLGHINLLGIRRPVVPMCAAGPAESFIGDPVWSSISEWADRARAQDGVVVSPHFPAPYCEVVADIILGKIDGVELRDFTWGVDSYGVREWYRLLNSGYRVAAVGGTDKMSAGMPLGGVRTYAWIGEEEFSFAAWAKAVRSGRTSTSSGPLVEMTVDGHAVGDTIAVGSGDATLEVDARATSVQPLGALELVLNGRVVERAEAQPGASVVTLKSRLSVQGGGWIAARCDGPSVLWHEWPIRTAAHTSPVYLAGGRGGPEGGDDRVFLMTILEGGLAWLDTLAIPADDAQHERIRRVFLDAMRQLRRQ
ncbi:MAG: CehA/McbA family metallohydrolase [Chloroflexota bacterium]|nr:CehA/McbA family metallohydrolase [Chloroflexota bacterium]